MLHFRLVTPERTLLDEDVASVSLPTVSGEVTILPHHAPFTAIVVSGIAHMNKADGSTDEIAMSDGFVHVTSDGKVTVLADTAERGHELELTAIEEAKTRAVEVMKKAAMQDDVAFAAASAAVERELARYRLAQKHRSKRHEGGASE